MKRIYNTIHYKTLDSTNNEAKRLMSGLGALTVLTADCQTAGRGQRGNSWHSSPGKNLIFSLVVRWGEDGMPSVSASGQFAVSMAATVSLAGMLSDEGIECRIKWPNDMYAGDRKICGILIENTVCGDSLSSSIIGIGLNVGETDFPDSLPNPVSMVQITGKDYDMAGILRSFLERFDSCIGMMESADGMESLRKSFLDKMYLKDIMHDYMDMTSGEKFTGIIRGVADNACLSVEMPDGSIREFAFKEISYCL